MEEVKRIQTEFFTAKIENRNAGRGNLILPAILAIGGAFAMLGLRCKSAKLYFRRRFDDARARLYLLAALFQLTNLYAPSEMAQKIGLWRRRSAFSLIFELARALGRSLSPRNGSAAAKRKYGNAVDFRYIPFANLYDLSHRFRFRRGHCDAAARAPQKLSILSAFSLPLAALILTLARFIGGEFVDSDADSRFLLATDSRRRRGFELRRGARLFRRRGYLFIKR
jgi:hypothetical protein